jgi:hypothetical protein
MVVRPCGEVAVHTTFMPSFYQIGAIEPTKYLQADKKHLLRFWRIKILSERKLLFHAQGTIASIIGISWKMAFFARMACR